MEMNTEEHNLYKEIISLFSNKMNNGMDGERVVIVTITAIRTFVNEHANEPIKSLNYIQKELMRNED